VTAVTFFLSKIVPNLTALTPILSATHMHPNFATIKIPSTSFFDAFITCGTKGIKYNEAK
jgi:hypothetical protein